MRSVIRILLLAMLSFWTSMALAQTGGAVTDEVGGDWAAIHHTENDINTDVCIAASNDGRLVIRSDKDDVEIRSSNQDWSLSVGTKGDMKISVGKYSKVFPMLAVKSDLLATEVSNDDMKQLLDAMDTGTSADLLFGQKTHEAVSLFGSTRALNSFRACTQSAGFADLGGAAGKSNSPF